MIVTVLHAGAEVELHVVAQIVKAELVVRPVRNVGRISGLPLKVVHVVLNTADRQTQEAIDLTHPFGIASGEVIVHGDDVHPAPGEGVEISRQSRHQGLAFAGAHLGNLALVQDDAADHLHIKVAHTRIPLPAFPTHSKRLRSSLLRASLTASAICCLKPSVRARSSSSESAWISGSNSLMCATTGRMLFRNRSLLLPKTLVRTLSKLIMVLSTLKGRRM